MKNPVRSLPMFNPAVPDGTFRRAFFKGLGSGALMMGIFSALNFTAITTGLAAALHIGSYGVGLAAATTALPGMLGMIAIGMVATGLFSGIMATQRSASEYSSASRESHEAGLRAPARAPEYTVAPVLASAVENQRSWQSRVGGPGGRDRVSEILADGSLSDRDRASAILSEREQASTLEASR